jgi:hypothetical protein
VVYYANKGQKHASSMQYLANVAKQAFQPEWPTDFFKNVVGGWRGEPLQRADQGSFDATDPGLFRDN